ncbi:MAG: sorbosone dehydrogenase [Candidatus Rokuibacteriota bacterium]|nr:MAG: sorbosone dehydrogenase [Candidatus Rokubacteria bacterium]
MKRLALVGLGVVLCLGAAVGYWRWTGQLPGLLLEMLLGRVRLPPGFTIQLYSSYVPNARSMALGARGTLFVGSRRAGRVYALAPRDRDDRAGEIRTIASGLNAPNGVAFRDGSLYVAEVNRVLRYDDIEARVKDPPAPVVVSASLPSDPNHGWRFIRFGPDGGLYVSVGAPCNVCESTDERYGTIMRMRPDGTGLEVFARGVRNSVGFAWHPLTGQLWFTDNGRDWMGDDLPPDELNRAPHKGMHFGFPYCHGIDVSDPELAQKRSCTEFEPPALELGAHVAALGMCFYTGSSFPAYYRNQIFIAEHGSWNRSSPAGYRVTLIRLKDDRPVTYEPFADGWRLGLLTWGRPVDVLVAADGALLISDDYAGAIYRVSYKTARPT